MYECNDINRLCYDTIYHNEYYRTLRDTATIGQSGGSRTGKSYVAGDGKTLRTGGNACGKSTPEEIERFIGRCQAGGWGSPRK